MIKGKQFFVFFLFFFLVTPFSLKAINLGISVGGGYEAWEKVSSPKSMEMANYLWTVEAVGFFQPFQRLLLLPTLGYEHTFSFNTTDIVDTPEEVAQKTFQSFYLGSRIGWLIHPLFSPFIGGGVYVKFYDRIFETQNPIAVTLNFSCGAKIMKMEESDLWVFFDYGLFNSQFKKYYLSFFQLSFAYLMHF